MEKEKSLEETSTWAVAVVCFVLLFISIFLEHSIHKIGTWFKKKNKKDLYEALEKIKAELMLLGFISLLLTVGQNTISSICISKSVASTMHPCSPAKKAMKNNTTKLQDGEKSGRRLLLELAESYIPRRSLATKGDDKCTIDGKVAFVSAYGIHQLHVFIFVLAVVHVIYSVLTYALGNIKMKRWKIWEEETSTIEYQYSNDPERFRLARETTFGRRHLSFWSKSSVTIWIVCFFRQLFASVTKTDYLALRHGFIMAHLAPGKETRFDFRKYIQRSLEEDFKTIVGINPVIWFATVLFLLTNTHGLHSYYWFPFIPLVIILVVGTKLQVIITKLGLRIQEKGDVVRGTPVVQPGDDLFWFDSPRSFLFLIHLVLFTVTFKPLALFSFSLSLLTIKTLLSHVFKNAFQLAFFAWSSFTFGIYNCFHGSVPDITIRLVVGAVVQILCSYVTLPLYALVTQMGTHMKSTVFNERVASAIKKWHHTAKQETKHGRHSESNTPVVSRPTTPTHGSSPIHLIHNNKPSSGEINQFYDPESQQQVSESSTTHHSVARESSEKEPLPASAEVPLEKTGKSVKAFSFKRDES